MSAQQFPCSPSEEIEGLVYFRRLCDKVRLMADGRLHPDLHANLGKAMDHWCCQFLGVDYPDLADQILSGKSDQEVLAWARKNGVERDDSQRDWWNSFMRNVGFRDHLAGRLVERIEESGLKNRNDILTMFDYMDADEGRG